MRSSKIFINLVPYIIFATLEIVVNLSDYFNYQNVAGILAKALCIYFVMPIIIFIYNVLYVRLGIFLRIAVGLSLGILFYIGGFLIMLLFVKIRIELGLPI